MSRVTLLLTAVCFVAHPAWWTALMLLYAFGFRMYESTTPEAK